MAAFGKSKRKLEWLEWGASQTAPQPSHAWRHRSQTQDRHLKIRFDVVDAITGHASTTVAADYGDYLTEMQREAICLMPRYLRASANNEGCEHRVQEA